MDAMTICPTRPRHTGQAVKAGPGDPLDADSPLDDVVITTSRALCRLALVATETGARFQREAEPHDPMAWLLAPRRMFGGSTALEACLQRDHFMRALILHGLSLGLDADPDEMDALLDESSAARAAGRTGRSREDTRGVGRLRVYTAGVLRSAAGSMLQGFHASVATSEGEFRARLEEKFGPAAAERAEIRAGFDPASPMAVALLPAPVAKVLRKVDREGVSAEYANLAITIEHRLEA